MLFTTFPKLSESFLQREVAAFQSKGFELRLYSMWGGGGEFRGIPVRRFNLWELVPLFLLTIPWNCVRRPRVIRDLFEGLCLRRPPSWLNFWENMLGAGFAGCFYREFRRDPPAIIYGAWAGAPATAGWLLWRLVGLPYCVGAHAYDLYEHGGDWWLLEKLEHARFVHTSTEMGRRELASRGVDASRVFVIRRGLESFPLLKPLRADRRKIRVVCIARLVAKKGLRHQIRGFAALRAAGVDFEVRIVGDGPMRNELEALARESGVADRIGFVGQQPQEEVWRELAWADVLVHTGIVAPSGDRDGLANVIPEAMAAGVVVVATPMPATLEAVEHGQTGLLADVTRPEDWAAVVRRAGSDDELAERLRAGARSWVERNYDADRNTGRLAEKFREAMRQ